MEKLDQLLETFLASRTNDALNAILVECWSDIERLLKMWSRKYSIDYDDMLSWFGSNIIRNMSYYYLERGNVINYFNIVIRSGSLNLLRKNLEAQKRYKNIETTNPESFSVSPNTREEEIEDAKSKVETLIAQSGLSEKEEKVIRCYLENPESTLVEMGELLGINAKAVDNVGTNARRKMRLSHGIKEAPRLSPQQARQRDLQCEANNRRYKKFGKARK